MKIISHRGNLEGLTPSRENSPSFIDEAIKHGYDAEVDLRIKDGLLFFGHDEPQYEVSEVWLHQRRKSLWIHAKDYEAFFWLHSKGDTYQYFWHSKDEYTIISNGLIWCHDIKNHNEKCIIPLLSDKQIKEHERIEAYGVCTDYVFNLEKKLKGD